MINRIIGIGLVILGIVIISNTKFPVLLIGLVPIFFGGKMALQKKADTANEEESSQEDAAPPAA